MFKRKIFRRTLIYLLTVSILMLSTVGIAEIKLYTATGEGYSDEFESQDIGKQRALDKAIKKATKQAGVYLKTYSRSVNSELTDDEVIAIASNSWQLVGEPKFTPKIINHSGDTQIIVWTAQVEVNVDDSEVISWIERDSKEKSTLIQQTRETQKKSEENDRKVEDLRKRKETITDETEKTKLKKEFEQLDRDFLANQKLKEALKFAYAKNYQESIKLNTEALELKPNWDFPYNNRGNDYSALGKYDLAIADFNKAIQLNPNWYLAYNNRGIAYKALGKYDLAIADFNKSIELNPNDADYYNNRGSAYGALKSYDLAIQDFTKAIQLNPNWYGAYVNRGICYQQLGENEKAESDFAKAKELGYEG